MLARGVFLESVLLRDAELVDLEPLRRVVSAFAPRMTATDAPGTLETAADGTIFFNG